MLFSPGPLTGELDELCPLFRRQYRQEGQRRRCQLAPKAASLLRRFVEQLHDSGLVGIWFGELGPGVTDHRLDRVAHRLHAHTHGMSVYVKGLLLLRVESELRLDLLEPLLWVDRQRRSMKTDP